MKNGNVVYLHSSLFRGLLENDPDKSQHLEPILKTRTEKTSGDKQFRFVTSAMISTIVLTEMIEQSPTRVSEAEAVLTELTHPKDAVVELISAHQEVR